MSVIFINPYRFTAATAYDPDAQDYINRVIAADVAAGNNSGLEVGVQDAYNEFFVDCKSDGMFNAIKACCTMAGARTLAGALVPLVGAAPTNFNFGAEDYNRKTGLKGDGDTKYLDANTPNSTAALNNSHISVYASELQTADAARVYLGAFETNTRTQLSSDTNSQSSTWIINDTGSLVPRFNDSETGFKGLARNNSANFIRRTNSSSTTVARNATTVAPGSASFNVFAANGNFISDARLAYYSIGESLDLALLDSRVTTLINAIAAAIP